MYYRADDLNQACLISLIRCIHNVLLGGLQEHGREPPLKYTRVLDKSHAIPKTIHMLHQMSMCLLA